MSLQIRVLWITICIFLATTASNAQTSIVMNFANCTATASEIQFDVTVTNTSTVSLQFNSCVVRGTVAAGIFSGTAPTTAGGFQFAYVGGSDFPNSWPPIGTATPTWTNTSRQFNVSTGTSIYLNGTTCAAPNIPAGATRKLGRFRLTMPTGQTYVSGQAVGLTFASTAASTLYINCAQTTTAYNSTTGTNTRTLGGSPTLFIPQACAVTASATAGPISCFGGTTTVSVTGANGTAPYSGTGTFTVSANTYTYTVTDANSCSATTTITITQPSAVSAAASSGSIACNGGTAPVTVSATGGTGTYTGTGSFNQGATTTVYTVSDANGCSTTTSVTLTQPLTSPVSITAATGSIKCTGGTASITVSANGGTGSYTGTGIFNQAATTIIYTVSDANGCNATTSITLTQPLSLTVSATSPAIACNGSSSSVTVSASGGTGLYSGTGVFSQSTNSATYTVVDANGCSATTSASVIFAQILQNDTVVCKGASINLTANNFIQYNFSLEWSNIYSSSYGGFGRGIVDNDSLVLSGAYWPTWPSGTTDQMITKIASNGNLAWQNIRAPGWDHDGYVAVQKMSNGNYAFFGQQNAQGTQYFDGFWTIFNLNGQEQSYGFFSVPGSTSGSDFKRLPNNKYVFSGPDGNFNHYVALTDSNFTQLAYKTFFIGGWCGSNIALDTTNNFIYVLGSYSAVGFFKICKYDYSLNLLSEFTFNTLGNTLMYDFDFKNGFLYLVGEEELAGVRMGKLMKIDSNGNVILSKSLPYSSEFTAVVSVTGGVITALSKLNGLNSYTNQLHYYSENFQLLDTFQVVNSPFVPFDLINKNNILYVAGAQGSSHWIGIPRVDKYTIQSSPLIYSWSTGATTPNITVSPTQTTTYYCTVSNGSSSCTDSVTVYVNNLSASASSGSIACFGGSTTVTVSATGGNGSYSGTGSFNRSSGTSVFTVSDASGCSATSSITLTQPALLSAAASSGSIACFGGTTTVTISAAGGTGAYTGTGALTRAAGTSVFTVTDANGCSATTSITLTQPQPFTIQSSAGSIKCNGGTTNLSVSETGSTSTSFAITVPAGSYSFSMTNSNGCVATSSITITQPPVLTASATSGVITCYNGSTGVSVSALGGTPSYSGTGSFNQSAGTTTYTVTDANGCSATTSVSLTQPAPFLATAASGSIKCFGGNTQVSVSGVGGTQPLTGTGTFAQSVGTTIYTVTDAIGCRATTSLSLTQPTVVTASATGAILCNGGTATVTVSAAGGTGNYTGTGSFSQGTGTSVYTVSDANGCIATTTLTLTQPALLTTSASYGTILCNGGTASVTISAAGGTSVYYGTGSFSQAVGKATYTVTDANGCSATISVTLTQPDELVASAEAGSIACNGGTASVTISATGGTGSYSGEGTFLQGATTAVYTVSDANGCSATTSVTLTDPAALVATATAGSIACNGGAASVTISAIGGTAAYTGTGIFNQTFGMNTYTVTDANGCSSTTSVTLTEPDALVVSSEAGTIACNGGITTVTIYANGGITPYTGKGTFSQGANTMVYTVSDANSCIATTSVTLTEPSVLVAIVTEMNPIACNGGTASIEVSANGGTDSYTGTGTFSQGANTMVYTVSDANGCSATTSITLTEPAALSASALVTSFILCNSESAYVDVNANGGTSPYAGTGTFSQSAGTTIYTVTDAIGCSSTTSVTLTEPSALVATATAGSISCNGGAASVTISAIGGTGSYSGTGSFNQSAGTSVYTVSDSNGCSATTSVTLTEPELLTAYAEAGTIACNGGSTSVTVSATGGTTAYSGTGTFTQSVGTITYTVTDANGCSAITSLTLTQPDALIASAEAGSIACNGGTASVTISSTGGIGSYSGAGTFTQGATTVVYTVNDANGCSATTSITLTEPALLSASASATSSILCNGGNASVDVYANGGTSPYAGTGTFSQSVGTTIYTITDANGCSSTTSVTLTEPTALVASAEAGFIACNGGYTSVTISASGGAGSYFETGTFNQSAGTTVYTVSDANGCSATTSVTSTEPELLTASAEAGTIACNGGSASVTIFAIDGTPAYTGTGNFVQLVGSQTYTVTDSRGCTSTTSVTLTQPQPLTAVASAPPFCFGGSTTATVTAWGGTQPYSYYWDEFNGSTNSFLYVESGDFNFFWYGVTSPGPWTVSIYVTDANGCTALTSVDIYNPDALTLAADANQIQCSGDFGSVTLAPTGGVPPYSFSGSSVSGLTEGTYTYTVTDALGCTATSSATIDPAPDPFSITATVTNVRCNGGNSGAVTLYRVGGSGAVFYSGTGITSPISTTASNLFAGNYTYTATDANGCSATTSVTITEPSTAVSASSTSGSILCNGGTTSVTISANGGTGSYTGTGIFIQGATTAVYTVTDANNCSATTSVTVSAPSAITISASAGSIECNGGTASVEVSAAGGTGSYLGTGAFNQSAGTTEYTVTDANGCSETTSVTLTEPELLTAYAEAGTIACNGGSTSVTVSATGGTTAYSGTGTFTQSVGSTTYTVTDARGCSETTSVTLTQPTTLIASAEAGSIACNGGTASVTIYANGGAGAYIGTGTFNQSTGTSVYTVSDSNGCSATTTITLTEPSILEASAVSGSIDCNGGTSPVTISAIGGTTAYTGTGTFNQLFGTRTYTVIDANGCSSTASVTLTQPASIYVSASAGSIECNGGTASVEVSAAGGTGSYLGTGAFNQSAGTTEYTVTDANGCSATTSVILSQPSTLEASALSGSIDCNGGTASVTITASGGTAAYSGTGVFYESAGTLFYTVTDANGCSSTTSVTLTEPSILVSSATSGSISCNGGTASVTISATGGTITYSGTGVFQQSAGTTIYTVSDVNKCSSTTSVTLTEPSVTVASATYGTIACNGESTTVTLSAVGGTGNYSGTGNFTQAASTVTYTVTDANGCSATTTVTITQPSLLQATYSVVNPVPCFGGLAVIDISATGGTGSYTGVGQYNQLSGTSTYVVMDDAGCIASVSATLSEPSKLELSLLSTGDAGCNGNSGTAGVTATGGTTPYTYQWSSGQTTASISGLSVGNYSVLVTDNRGCTSSLMTTVTQAVANPPVPGAVTGATYACRNSTQVYSVPSVAGLTYSWNLPGGATGTSSGNSITVNFGSTFLGGQICVASVNSCGTSATSCIPVNATLAAPTRPNSINGPTAICGPTVQQYSVNPIPGATSYSWVVNGGLSIISGNGTNSVQLNIPANFGQGTIFVTASNCIGTSSISSVTINGLPSSSNAILGPNMALCPGTTAIYSIAPVVGAQSYSWTATGDMILTPNANTCSVTFGPNWTTGVLSATTTNSCGSFTRNATLRSTTAQPGSITGAGSGLCNSTQNYSISPVSGATGYTWTAPAGVSVVGSGTSAVVTFPQGYTSNSTAICVTANNTCGASAARCFTVTTRPATPVVTGPSTVCRSASSYTYSTAGSPSATSYTWTVTGGGALASSGLTATINFLSSLTGTQQVRCVANNACGASQTGSVNVTVNACRSEGIDKTDLKAGSTMTVFPNPSTGHIQIQFNNLHEQVAHLLLQDLTGRVISYYTHATKEGENIAEIDLSYLPKGIYLLSLKNDQSMETVKVVLE